MLRIAATEYNAERQCLEVYVLGCSRQCNGCHNRELWPYGGRGRRWPEWLRRNRFKLRNDPIKEVWILGGDLMCQHDFCDVSEFLRSLFLAKPKDAGMWLWTGAEITEVPIQFIECLDYIKTGVYERNLAGRVVNLPDGTSIRLASCNQRIWKVDRERRTYDECGADEVKHQPVLG